METHMENVNSMAYDAANKLLWWTDDGKDTIELLSMLNGKFHNTIIASGRDNPRDIAIDSVHGHIYWVEHSQSKDDFFDDQRPTVYSAASNLEKLEEVPIGNLNQANAVFYSPVDEQLHVADSSAMRIQSFDREQLNPLNDVEIRDGLHVFAITMAEKNIYYSDWESNSIKLIDESGTKEISLASNLNRPTQLAVFGDEIAPLSEGVCVTQRNQCTHICLPFESDNFRCRCPEDLFMADDLYPCTTRDLLHKYTTEPPPTTTTTTTTTTSTTTTPYFEYTTYAVDYDMMNQFLNEQLGYANEDEDNDQSVTPAPTSVTTTRAPMNTTELMTTAAVEIDTEETNTSVVIGILTEAETNFQTTASSTEPPKFDICPDETIELPLDGGENHYIFDITNFDLVATDFLGEPLEIMPFEPLRNKYKLQDEPYEILVGAIDEFNQTAECQVSFFLVDTEAPRTIYCPMEIRAITFRKDKTSYVSWPEPVFKDNVGIETVISNETPKFFTTGLHTVVYTAKDAANNKARVVTIKL